MSLINRTQTLHLTLQLQIPQKLLDANQKSTELKTINHLRILYASPLSTIPITEVQDLPTLSSLLPTLSVPVVLLLPFHPSYSNPTPIDILLRQSRPKLYFPPLQLDCTLEEAFKGMSWVEFPVLRVMRREDWEKELAEGRVAIVLPAEGIGRVEKRQIDDGWAGRKKSKVDVDLGGTVSTPAGSTSVTGLNDNGTPAGLAGLNDYESDEEDAGEEVTEDDIKLLRTLGAAAAADMI
jgi:hypothetical protein